MTDAYSQTQPAAFTDEEKSLVKQALFGAIAMVSKAEPGFLDTLRESGAAAKAMAEAPPLMRELIGGGLTMPASPEEGSVEDHVLRQVGEAARVLDRDPVEGSSFRTLVESVIARVANADGEVSPPEQEMITKIRAAMGSIGETSEPQMAPAPSPVAPAPVPTTPPSAAAAEAPLS